LLVFLVQPLQQREHFGRRLRVEIARGLVGEQQRRVGDDRARDRDALLLPARELPRVVLLAIAEGDDAERRYHVIAALRLREIRQEQRQLHVLERGEHRDEVVQLEDEADVARAPGGERSLRQAAD